MVIPSFRIFSLSCLVALIAVATISPVSAQDATTGTTTNTSTVLKPSLKTEASSSSAGTITLSPVRIEKIRKSKRVATQMAKYEWLDKVAAADPSILAAICEHPGPAKLIAKHRHLNKLAEADHYLCRRLTRFPGATKALIHATYCDYVVALDPEGIYFAIARDPHVGTVLSSHTMFDEMVMTNPDLARVIAQHMR